MSWSSLQMTLPTFSYLTQTAVQAALNAGEILKKAFGTTFEISLKPGHQNFVTEFDKQSEKIILEMITREFPSHCILAEESGYYSPSDADKDYLWIIDPLDGTTNFSHHLPVFAISIAVCYQNKPISGVIYQPITNELFVTEKGIGAYLNNKPLTVSSTTKIDHALIFAGMPYGDNVKAELKYMEDIYLSGSIFRNLGSAALALAYVAAGKVDACWVYNVYPWDFAAGQLLIEEAGGFLKHTQLTEDFNKPSHILASNPHLYPLLESRF